MPGTTVRGDAAPVHHPLRPLGIHFTDTQNPDNVAAASTSARGWSARDAHQPLLRVSDISAIAALLDGHPRLAVDNTFATPALQNRSPKAPTSSCTVTKYLVATVVMGALMTKDAEVDANCARSRTTSGPSLSHGLLPRTGHQDPRNPCPYCTMAAPLPNGSTPTRKSTRSTARVLQPANHDVAARQMNDFGGMISFTLVDDSLAASEGVREHPFSPSPTSVASRA